MADQLQRLLSEKWNQGMTFPNFVAYSTKNVEKMRDNYTRTEIDLALAQEVMEHPTEVRLLVLGADWCGDAITNVPPVARLAELNEKIELRVLDRDRHDDLMVHYLTNGGKAIPKIIVASADFSRRTVWGPRPAPCQALMTLNKDKMPKEEIYPMIRAWYEGDNHRTLLNEIWSAIRSIS